RQILDINPDIVHFTGLQLSGFHMAVACHLAGVHKTVVTIRGSSTDAIEFSPIKRFMLAKVLEPFTLALSKKIIGVSDFVTTSKVANVFSKKVFGTIYNFPPLKKISSSSKVVTRDDLGFSGEDIIVVTVGRVNREKGLHILESAILNIGIRNNIKFIIVGEGDYLSQMKTNLSEQIAEGQVKFLGHRDDIFDINRLSDIFVLPTLHETLSNALLEASCAPLPLIASNTGGVPEIVQTGFNGVLVEPGDAEGLAKAILS
ncbi:glycosyltransferase, partial [Oleiphilus sp. HI0086]|uniref:glycosyltransferase n=1 Tax=Oleiphilus sp. HI0086 TaxID=1822260 RepID=UPI000A49C37C